jgi:hypothetical protein
LRSANQLDSNPVQVLSDSLRSSGKRFHVARPALTRFGKTYSKALSALRLLAMYSEYGKRVGRIIAQELESGN